jgi:hypothetical protein
MALDAAQLLAKLGDPEKVVAELMRQGYEESVARELVAVEIGERGPRTGS